MGRELIYEFRLELFEELVSFFRNPSVLPALSGTRVGAVMCCPLVFAVPAAPLDREAFVNIFEIVAEVTRCAIEFLRLFGACVGEVAVYVGLAVTP